MDDIVKFIDASLERYKYLVSGGFVVFSSLLLMIRFAKGVPTLFEIIGIPALILCGFFIACGAMVIARLHAVKVFALGSNVVGRSGGVADERQRDAVAGRFLGGQHTNKSVLYLMTHIFGVRKCGKSPKKMTLSDLECELGRCEARLPVSVLLGVTCFSIYAAAFAIGGSFT